MLQNYLKFPNRIVQTFGCVYLDTHGLNHGPVWKTQSFLLREICTVILWRLLWERQFEKVLLKCGWEKVSNWECSFVHHQKGYSYPCMWMTSNWLERNKQASKRSKKNGDKSAVAMLKKNECHQRTGRPVLDAYSSNTRQLGCEFQDMEPPKSSSILRKSSDIRKPIRGIKFTKAFVRHDDMRDQIHRSE